MRSCLPPLPPATALSLLQGPGAACRPVCRHRRQQLPSPSCRAQERHAVLSAATAASDSPRAEAVHLRSQLEGQQVVTARLEAELTAHRASAASR